MPSRIMRAVVEVRVDSDETTIAEQAQSLVRARIDNRAFTILDVWPMPGSAERPKPIATADCARCGRGIYEKVLNGGLPVEGRVHRAWYHLGVAWSARYCLAVGGQTAVPDEHGPCLVCGEPTIRGFCPDWECPSSPDFRSNLEAFNHLPSTERPVCCRCEHPVDEGYRNRPGIHVLCAPCYGEVH